MHAHVLFSKKYKIKRMPHLQKLTHLSLPEWVMNGRIISGPVCLLENVIGQILSSNHINEAIFGAFAYTVSWERRQCKTDLCVSIKVLRCTKRHTPWFFNLFCQEPFFLRNGTSKMWHFQRNLGRIYDNRIHQIKKVYSGLFDVERSFFLRFISFYFIVFEMMCSHNWIAIFGVFQEEASTVSKNTCMTCMTISCIS